MVEKDRSIEKIPSTEGVIECLLATQHHFFGNLFARLGSIQDPRNQQRIIYPLPCLMYTGILMFLCRLGARRQVHLSLNNEEAARKYASLFAVDAVPHGDTLDYLYSRLNEQEVQEAVCAMIERLVRGKLFYPFRLLDQYFPVVIDGTGRLTFQQEHCEHCIRGKSSGKELFYHPVLEAKLVVGSFVFSLMTEFIENPSRNVEIQDCELAAFYRMAPRLKKRFPRLPICLVADALYACGPVFSICEANHWKFLTTLKDQSLTQVNGEFEGLWKVQRENKLTAATGKSREKLQTFRWVNNIAYTDDSRQAHQLHVLECLESKDQTNQHTKFKWVSNLSISNKNCFEIANNGGRVRWKIENEGFNVQKNGGFGLEHPYSENLVASKVFYYLLQIAHMLMQLVERGSFFQKIFPKGLGSSKNIACRLKEEWLYRSWPKHFCDTLPDLSFQIRFNTS